MTRIFFKLVSRGGEVIGDPPSPLGEKGQAKWVPPEEGRVVNFRREAPIKTCTQNWPPKNACPPGGGVGRVGLGRLTSYRIDSTLQGRLSIDGLGR